MTVLSEVVIQGDHPQIQGHLRACLRQRVEQDQASVWRRINSLVSVAVVARVIYSLRRCVLGPFAATVARPKFRAEQEPTISVCNCSSRSACSFKIEHAGASIGVNQAFRSKMVVRALSRAHHKKDRVAAIGMSRTMKEPIVDAASGKPET